MSASQVVPLRILLCHRYADDGGDSPPLGEQIISLLADSSGNRSSRVAHPHLEPAFDYIGRQGINWLLPPALRRGVEQGARTRAG